MHNIFNDNNDSNLWCQPDVVSTRGCRNWTRDQMASRRKRPPKEEISSMGRTMGKRWSKFDQMSLVDGLLFRSFENEKGDCQHLQLCVPRILRNEVLEFTHDIPSAGHLGSGSLKEVLKKRLYWPNWKTDF